MTREDVAAVIALAVGWASLAVLLSVGSSSPLLVLDRALTHTVQVAAVPLAIGVLAMLTALACGRLLRRSSDDTGRVDL